MSRSTELSQVLRSKKEELVTLTEELVKAKSVTGHEQPAQDVVIDRLKATGLEPDVWEPDPKNLQDHEAFFETSSYEKYGYDGRPNVATYLEGGDGPTLTVGGHVDVVDVTDSEWEYEPWELRQEGDKLYGRGVADMKGGIAAVLIAIEALQEVGIELGGDLIFQSVIEEEDGGVGGTLSALERGYVPDAAIIAEPFNVPNLCVASAGVMYFRVTVPGKSIHAAWGHEGVNAIGKATKIYEALEELDAERKMRIDYPPAYRADSSLEGNVTNLNIGTIGAGDWPSTVPSEAVLEGRIGWPPGESRAEVRDQIESVIQSVAAEDEWLIEHPPELDWFGWQAEPHETDTDAEIVQVARTNAEEVTGETGMFVGGNAGLDERFFELYYDVPAVSIGPEGHNLHGADEHTTVSSLLETSETIAHSIVDYLGTAN
ncbi:acetylornithine deacetylase [Natronococcus pandeyae]|uniref:Acetylornithine deacetylase n=1 Tax=Natronococcus pandeyae TaxID=2055836 RepID=A0A8J8Q0T9_9EURY|nr:ArgE/DapE family deacylase [Natronococcus pandeyae]TYL37351.1 acetylornithine deacetylase [Natronococcus pandeyae]